MGLKVTSTLSSMSTEVVLGMICLAVQGSTVIATQQVPDTPQRREITTDARRLANKNKKKGNPATKRRKNIKKIKRERRAGKKETIASIARGGNL